MSFYGRSTYEIGKLFRNFEIYNQKRASFPSGDEDFPLSDSRDVIYPNELYDTLIMLGADPWIALNSDGEELAIRHFAVNDTIINQTIAKQQKTQRLLDFGNNIHIDRAGHTHIVNNNASSFLPYNGATTDVLYSLVIPTLPELYVYNENNPLLSISDRKDLPLFNSNEFISDYEKEVSESQSLLNLNVQSRKCRFRIVAADKWIELKTDKYDGGKDKDAYIEFRHHVPLTDDNTKIAVSINECKFGDTIYFDEARHFKGKLVNTSENKNNYSTFTIPAFPNFYVSNQPGREWKKAEDEVTLNHQNVPFSFVGANKWIVLNGDYTEGKNEIAFRHLLSPSNIVTNKQLAFGKTTEIYFDEAGHIFNEAVDKGTTITLTMPNIVMTCFDD